MVALLQYVANQLKSSESLDLLVLKEMVATMTASALRVGCLLAARKSMTGAPAASASKVWPGRLPVVEPVA